MNENRPTAVYLPALKGETSRIDPNEANELEGVVENIRVMLQADAGPAPRAEKKKLSRYLFHFEVFKKNERKKKLEKKQDKDENASLPKEKSFLGKQSIIGRILGGKMEKIIDEEEEDAPQNRAKATAKKGRKSKKKTYTTRVREKILQDLVQAVEDQGKIDFQLGEKVTAICTSKDSKHLYVASYNTGSQAQPPASASAETEPQNLKTEERNDPSKGSSSSLWKINVSSSEKEKISLSDCNVDIEKEIKSILVTSDEKYLITGWSDGSLLVYDLPQRKAAHKFKNVHEHGVKCLALTSDDQLVISGGFKDKNLKIFDIQNRNQKGTIENAHQDWINCVAITYDKKYVISGSDAAIVRVHDIKTKTLKHTFEMPKITSIYQHEDKNFVFSVCTTRDSKYIAASLKDKSVILFDLEKAEMTFVFEGFHETRITSLAVTSDDRYIITGSYGGSLRVFDIQKREKIHTFEKIHKGPITSIVVSQDRRYIASGSNDGFVKLYEVEKSNLVGVIENAHTRGVDALTVTRDQKYVLSGSYDGQLRLFDIETRQPSFTFKSSEGTNIKSVAITSDNRWAIAGTDDSSILIYDTQNPDLEPDVLENVHHLDWVNALGITQDDKHLVSAGGDSIRVFDLVTREPVHTYQKAHEKNIRCLKITLTNYIVTGSDDNSIRIFTTRGEQGGFIHVFEKAHTDSVTCLDVTKDDKYIISGSKDNSIRIFDFEKRELVYSFAGLHKSSVLSLAVTSDSQYIISGSDDSSILIIDLENRRPLHVIDQAHEKQVTCVAVSADAKYLISCSADYNDNSIKIFSNPYFNPDATISEFNSISPYSYYGLFILKTFLQENEPTRKQRFLSKYQDLLAYPYSFNLFHIVAVFAPTLNLIKYCIDNRIPFTGDVEGRTPIHYILHAQQINYTNINLVLENFYRLKDSSEYYKMMGDLTRDLPKILNFSPKLVLNVLKLAVANPQSYKNEAIPRFGSIVGKDSRRIIPYQSTIFTPEIKEQLLNEEGNDLLSTKVLLFNMNYDLYSDEVLRLLLALKDIYNEEIFQSKAITVLIDYLWDASRMYHYGLELVYTALIVILSIYSTQQKDERSTGLEVVLLIFGFGFLGYELLQMVSAGLIIYFAEIWNFVDVLGNVCLITSIFLSWSDVEELRRDWLMSITLFMSYAKWISFFRIIDQARKLIRIIIEIIKDIRSFLAILTFIIMGSSLIFFQFDDDSTSYGDRLLFVYALVYASFDTTGFSLSQIIYLIVVTVMLSVVLLNLLIAIMTATYERVEVMNDLTDGLEKVYMILETVIVKRAFRKFTKCCQRRKNPLQNVNNQREYLFFAEKVTSRASEEKENEWEGKAGTVRKVISNEMQKHYEPMHARLLELETDLNKQEDRIQTFERDVDQQVGRLDKQIAQILDLLTTANGRNITFGLNPSSE